MGAGTGPGLRDKRQWRTEIRQRRDQRASVTVDSLSSRNMDGSARRSKSQIYHVTTLGEMYRGFSDTKLDLCKKV